MLSRVVRGILLGVMAMTIVVIPVLATYYAYIYVEESTGNSYDNLPLICSANITQLADNKFISSSGLDTRVLTGEGASLPHILANDKILFTTDLEADEEKTLIFYTGATSLSNFPIIVGYNGYITTEDDEDLELTYILELLASGYFDASAGASKNILYKEDAFKINISAANTLRVAGLEAGDAEQWEMHYGSFTSGVHTVYVTADGMQAALYVDNFVTPKDTENLFVNGNYQITATASIWNTYLSGRQHNTCYGNGRFWCFYINGSDVISWRSSTDGASWASEQTVAAVSGDSVSTSMAVWYWDGYVHIAYGAKRTGDDYVRYRRGFLESNGDITWSADWQIAQTVADGTAKYASIAVDNSGYPFIAYAQEISSTKFYVTKSSTNDGTWTTAGGYPWLVYNGDSVAGLTAYTNSDDMYLLYSTDASNWRLYGKYYNGTAWAAAQTICSTMDCGDYSAVSDVDGNLYIVWEETAGGPGAFLRVRYADGSLSSIIELSAQGQSAVVSYNEDTGGVYIFYRKGGDTHVYGQVLIGGSLIGEYQYSSMSMQPATLSATPYTNHIGVAGYASSKVEHQYLTFPWDWNDNSNNWTWMQNNCMPYASDLMIGIDGVLELEYKPATIIQGTALPDVSEASGHHGIITWGSNPDGVDVSISGLQSDETEDQYQYYPYIETGSQDIIKPEPAGLISNVNLEILERNPFNPLVEAIADVSGGQLTESLVWLGGAIFCLIAAVTFVLIKSRFNITFTCLVGLGVSVLFYVVMPIFPLAVVILFCFGALASFILERMPTW